MSFSGVVSAADEPKSGSDNIVSASRSGDDAHLYGVFRQMGREASGYNQKLIIRSPRFR
jgi:hypothetical protein